MRRSTSHRTTSPNSTRWCRTICSRCPITSKARTAARRRAFELNPDAAQSAAEVARRERFVTVRPTVGVGTAALTAIVPAEQAELCHAALTHQAQWFGTAATNARVSQIMADTLVERITGQTTASAVPVAVGLLMNVTTLLGTDDTPAQLIGHGPLPAGVARALATTDSAWLRRLFTDPIDATVAHADTGRRRFDTALRDLCLARDQQCRAPVAPAGSPTSTTTTPTPTADPPPPPTAAATTPIATPSNTTPTSSPTPSAEKTPRTTPTPDGNSPSDHHSPHSHHPRSATAPPPETRATTAEPSADNSRRPPRRRECLNLPMPRTERLDLSVPTMNDLDELHAVFSNPQVWLHYPSLRHTTLEPDAGSARGMDRWLGHGRARPLDGSRVGYAGCGGLRRSGSSRRRVLEPRLSVVHRRARPWLRHRDLTSGVERGDCASA